MSSALPDVSLRPVPLHIDQVCAEGCPDEYLLHDVVEDEDVTLSDIRDKFGDEVEALVDGACEPEELIHADGSKSKTWHERKAHTIDFIKNADRDLIRDYDRLRDLKV